MTRGASSGDNKFKVVLAPVALPTSCAGLGTYLFRTAQWLSSAIASAAARSAGTTAVLISDPLLPSMASRKICTREDSVVNR